MKQTKSVFLNPCHLVPYDFIQIEDRTVFTDLFQSAFRSDGASVANPQAAGHPHFHRDVDRFIGQSQFVLIFCHVFEHGHRPAGNDYIGGRGE